MGHDLAVGRSWIAGRRGDDGSDQGDDTDDEAELDDSDVADATDAPADPDPSGDEPDLDTTDGGDAAATEPDTAEPGATDLDKSASVSEPPAGRVAAALQEAKDSLLEITPLQWAWMAGSVVLGALLMALVGIARDTADGTVDRDHAELWNSAIGQLGAVLVILAVLYALGWLHEAGVNSSYQRWGLRWSPFILIGCLLPGLAVLGTSWEPYERIGALAADSLTSAAFEELAFRGLLLIVVARGLAEHRHGVLLSAITVGVVFGLVDLSVSSLLLGTLFSLAVVRLILDTNSIWPAVVLHAMFDWLGEFPFLDDGTGEGSGWTTLAVLVVIVAAAHAGRRLAGEHAPWQALMSPNVAPVPRR